MSPEPNLYHALAREFVSAGYNATTNGTSFHFLPLNLSIELNLVKKNDLPNGTCSMIIEVCCRHDKFPWDIREITVGGAENADEATALAFNNWIVGDFPPIHDYLCGSGDRLGDYLETASHSGELNKIIGWDIFSGPCLETNQSRNVLETTISKQSKTAAQLILFQAMTDAIFGTPGMYYIRTFMSKNKSGEIDCDCRVNSNDWEHGKSFLINFIKQQPLNSEALWFKQNMLLVSKPAEEIQSGTLLEKLNAALREQQQTVVTEPKKWWKFWD